MVRKKKLKKDLINDREFRLVLPKYDNSGMKIKTSKIRDVVDKMTDNFKGVTVYPSVIGCWIGDDKKKVCEENIIISSVRDSESTENFNSVIKEDLKFIKSLASEVGMDLGQESILYGDSKTEVTFAPGEKIKKLPKSKVGRDAFSNLI